MLLNHYLACNDPNWFFITIQVQKCAKKMQSKRAQKNVKSGDEEECNAAVNGQISSSCYSSDNESINSQEMNGGGSASSSSKGSPALNLNAKTRAGRGSATDPQSLYARVLYIYKPE